MTGPEVLDDVASRRERSAARRLAEEQDLAVEDALAATLAAIAARRGATLDALVVERLRLRAAMAARAAESSRLERERPSTPGAWTAWFDGSSNGRTEAGVGALLKGPNGETVEMSRCIGHADGVTAELRALVEALDACVSRNAKRLIAFGDSLAAIDFASGKHSPARPDLAALTRIARTHMSRIGDVELHWISRAQNDDAHRLAQAPLPWRDRKRKHPHEGARYVDTAMVAALVARPRTETGRLLTAAGLRHPDGVPTKRAIDDGLAARIRTASGHMWGWHEQAVPVAISAYGPVREAESAPPFSPDGADLWRGALDKDRRAAVRLAAAEHVPVKAALVRVLQAHADASCLPLGELVHRRAKHHGEHPAHDTGDSQAPWLAWTSGARDPESGGCALGVHLFGPDGEEVAASRRVAVDTRLLASYAALETALEHALSAKARNLVAYSDFEAVVKQMTGAWTAPPAAAAAVERARALSAQFERVEFALLHRELNRRAETLAKSALADATSPDAPALLPPRD